MVSVPLIPRTRYFATDTSFQGSLYFVWVFLPGRHVFFLFLEKKKPTFCAYYSVMLFLNLLQMLIDVVVSVCLRREYTRAEIAGEAGPGDRCQH